MATCVKSSTKNFLISSPEIRNTTYSVSSFIEEKKSCQSITSAWNAKLECNLFTFPFEKLVKFSTTRMWQFVLPQKQKPRGNKSTKFLNLNLISYIVHFRSLKGMYHENNRFQINSIQNKLILFCYEAKTSMTQITRITFCFQHSFG